MPLPPCPPDLATDAAALAAYRAATLTAWADTDPDGRPVLYATTARAVVDGIHRPRRWDTTAGAPLAALREQRDTLRAWAATMVAYLDAMPAADRARDPWTTPTAAADAIIRAATVPGLDTYDDEEEDPTEDPHTYAALPAIYRRAVDLAREDR